MKTNEQTSQFMQKIFLFALSILFSGLIQPAFGQVPAPDFDLPVTLNMKTDDGKVRVILPADIRAGDTITGTVISNLASNGMLEGEVIEIKTVEGEVVATKNIKKSSGSETASSNEFFTFTVPQGASSLILSCTGKHIKDGIIKVTPNTNFSSNIPTQPGSFAPPRLGQTGRDISIPGNFDGNAGTTTVNIGGRQIPVIAESPRKAVVQIPADTPTGSTDITINEHPANGTPSSQTKPFNVVSLQMKADKLSLMKGERTNLYITITGVSGAYTTGGTWSNLHVSNETPNVVHMSFSPAFKPASNNLQGGQTGASVMRTVPPSGGNEITFTEQLTGVSPGNFLISATLFMPQMMGGLAPPASLKEQLEDIAAKKESAANAVNGNTKAVKKLNDNAEKVRGWAGSELDDDGNPKDKDGLVKKLKKEKEDLKEIKTSLSASNAAAIAKIGEAMDAVDALIKVLEAK